MTKRSLVFFFFLFAYLNAQEKPARINGGIIKERHGKVNEAIEDYKRYIQKHPEDINIMLRLMNLLFRERRYNDVVSLYDGLSENLKKRREIIAMLGRAYFLLGKREETIRTLRFIISNEDGAEASYSFVGNFLLSIGFVKDAKIIFLEGRRKLGETHFSRELYLCYIRENNYKEAIREIYCYYKIRKSSRKWVRREIENLLKKDKSLLFEIEKLAKENKDYLKLTGEILLELGELKKAKKYLLQTLDAGSLLNFASICLNKGFYQEAETSLKKVISGNAGEKEKVLYLLSKTYEKTKRFDEAIKTLDKIIKEGKSLKDSAIIEKARILIFDKKEFKTGVSIIKPIIEKHKTSSDDAILEIAVTGYIKSSNLKDAERVLRRNNSAFSNYLKGEIFFLEGSFEKSKASFLMAASNGLEKEFANNALERIMIMERLKREPAFLSVIKDVAKMVWEEKFDDAIFLINNSFDNFKKKEERAVLLFYKGNVYASSGRINDAIASYKSIFDENKKDPLSAKALYKAALLYKDRIKKPLMAKEMLRKVIFEYPNSVEADLSRGELEVVVKESGQK